ncbi:hypothetical protein [Paraglaciecola sp.]|uniref:hypothetical protein n=1 Tax=Paraglaciecola sp. TaxID=1920173 RepID=UPI0030F3A0BB
MSLAVLSDWANECSQQTCSFKGDGPTPYFSFTSVLMYRLVKELLMNVTEYVCIILWCLLTKR